MKKIRTAFQGELGAFSQEAVGQLLGDRATVAPFQRFDEVFRALSDKSVDAAVIPIENTLAGSVYENFDLLQANNLHIVSEVSLRIVHNLIAMPGTTRKAVRQVYSHPVALAQCQRFFAKNPKIERITYYDTAGSVKMLAERRPPGAAAIASRIAAEVYDARILATHLEDHRENYTRFFLLSKTARVSPRANKISIVFSTRNIPGALYKCLSVFALRDIDLTKMESRPLHGRPWEYSFYIDFAGNVKEERCKKALDHLSEVTNFLRVLGCYEGAKR